jgi:hypothetical protein
MNLSSSPAKRREYLFNRIFFINKTFIVNSDVDYHSEYGSLVLNSDATDFTLPVSNIKEWKEIHV